MDLLPTGPQARSIESPGPGAPCVTVTSTSESAAAAHLYPFRDIVSCKPEAMTTTRKSPQNAYTGNPLENPSVFYGTFGAIQVAKIFETVLQNTPNSTKAWKISVSFD